MNPNLLDQIQRILELDKLFLKALVIHAMDTDDKKLQTLIEDHLKMAIVTLAEGKVS